MLMLLTTATLFTLFSLLFMRAVDACAAPSTAAFRRPNCRACTRVYQHYSRRQRDARDTSDIMPTRYHYLMILPLCCRAPRVAARCGRAMPRVIWLYADFRETRVYLRATTLLLRDSAACFCVDAAFP